MRDESKSPKASGAMCESCGGPVGEDGRSPASLKNSNDGPGAGTDGQFMAALSLSRRKKGTR